MTPEQINIAIAKVCGWRFADDSIYSPTGSSWAVRRPDGDLVSLSEIIPYYSEDLNAMHEAEKVLKVSQWQTYTQHLGKLTGTVRFCVAHATAAQRAEAFLRTLNLWAAQP